MAIYRVKVLQVFNASVDVQNTMHFWSEEPWTTAARYALATALSLAWELLEPYLSNLLVHGGFTIQRVDLVGQPVYQLPFDGVGNGTGNATATPLATQTAGVLNFNCAQAYPRRARQFLGGFCENASDGTGVPNSTVKSLWTSYANALLAITSLDGISSLLVTVKYTGSPGVASSYNILTGSSNAALWGTLRSRRK